MIWAYIKSLYYYIYYRIKQPSKDEDSLITIVETSETSEEEEQHIL